MRYFRPSAVLSSLALVLPWTLLLLAVIYDSGVLAFVTLLVACLLLRLRKEWPIPLVDWVLTGVKTRFKR